MRLIWKSHIILKMSLLGVKSCISWGEIASKKKLYLLWTFVMDITSILLIPLLLFGVFPLLVKARNSFPAFLEANVKTVRYTLWNYYIERKQHVEIGTKGNQFSRRIITKTSGLQRSSDGNSSIKCQVVWAREQWGGGRAGGRGHV